MIEISQHLLREVIDHARRGVPEEVCGWLVGEGNRVSQIVPVTNVAEKPETNFRMDPGAQLATMLETRGMGSEIIGTYHSHPWSPAIPSYEDRNLALYPKAMHLIVSLFRGKPEARCYCINENGRFDITILIL